MPPTLRSRQRSSTQSRRRTPITKKSHIRSAAMVATRASTRKAGAAGMASAPPRPSPASSTSSSTATSHASTPTFPELVRSRVAYSPAPSVASHASSALTASDFRPNKPRQHLLWPSQLCAAPATAAPLYPPYHHHLQRAASSASSAGSPEPLAGLPGQSSGKAGERLMRERAHSLDDYVATLQSALRNGGRR